MWYIDICETQNLLPALTDVHQKPKLEYVNPLALGDVVVILKVKSPNTCYGLGSWAFLLPQNTLDEKSILV